MLARKLFWLLPLAAVACNQESLTRDEAVQALTEASIENEAASATTTPIEISTSFTLGGAVEQAAANLRDFLVAELPCATVTLATATVTTQWGSGCTYKGMTFSGTSSVTVKRTDPGSVEVDHTWTDFSNGIVKVTGTAQVTWSGAEHSRHVVHDLSWTRLSDARTGHGTGDRTQTLLDPAQGLLGGIEVNGNRHWTGNAGAWDVAITGVEMRPQDPVPQAGSYALTTPANKSLTLSFARLSTTVIRVTISGPKHDYSFSVRETGAFTDG
jgi:hypothetical protein